MNANFNEWCKAQDCADYIEWDYQFDKECHPYPCTSCKRQGQSYDIDKIADDCPFKGREPMPRPEVGKKGQG